MAQLKNLANIDFNLRNYKALKGAFNPLYNTELYSDYTAQTYEPIAKIFADDIKAYYKHLIKKGLKYCFYTKQSNRHSQESDFFYILFSTDENELKEIYNKDFSSFCEIWQTSENLKNTSDFLN